MNNDSDDSLVIGGLVVLAVVTAPIWLPALLGSKPKYCECSSKIEPNIEYLDYARIAKILFSVGDLNDRQMS